jgi:hypothetical protein
MSEGESHLLFLTLQSQSLRLISAFSKLGSLYRLRRQGGASKLPGCIYQPGANWNPHTQLFPGRWNGWAK